MSSIASLAASSVESLTYEHPSVQGKHFPCRRERVLGQRPSIDVASGQFAFSLLRTTNRMSSESAIMTTANIVSLPSVPSRSSSSVLAMSRRNGRRTDVPSLGDAASGSSERSATIGTVSARAGRRPTRRPMPNGMPSTLLGVRMDDIDPDTLMVAAGVVLSLIAVMEIYPIWKRSRDD